MFQNKYIHENIMFYICVHVCTCVCSLSVYRKISSQSHFVQSLLHPQVCDCQTYDFSYSHYPVKHYFAHTRSIIYRCSYLWVILVYVYLFTNNYVCMPSWMIKVKYKVHVTLPKLTHVYPYYLLFFRYYIQWHEWVHSSFYSISTSKHNTFHSCVYALDPDFFSPNVNLCVYAIDPEVCFSQNVRVSDNSTRGKTLQKYKQKLTL